MIKDLIFATRAGDGVLELRLSEPIHHALIELRQFMYENVYRSAQVHEDFEKSKKILSELYAYFMENEDGLDRGLADLQMAAGGRAHEPRKRRVCDFIASMTDRYAMNLYAGIFFPSPFQQRVN
jgi:dGTPase